MTTQRVKKFQSPLGDLTLVAQHGALVALHWPDDPDSPAETPAGDAVLEAAARQLAEYFAGQRQAFELPLRPAAGGSQGTPFQRLVWAQLCRIPFGQTASYRALAEAIGRPNAARAVGAANGRNPLPIVVPCHRVVGSGGSLTGFSGGLAVKRRLLALEQNPHRPPAGRVAGT